MYEWKVFQLSVLHSQVGKESSNSLWQNSNAVVHVEKVLKNFHGNENKSFLIFCPEITWLQNVFFPSLLSLKKTHSYIACSKGT